MPLPEVPFSDIDTWTGRADKFSTVHVDKNRYSVPTEYALRKVSAVIGVDRVELYRAGKRIAGHERIFANNKWRLDPMHYPELIRRRPQAFDSARPIRQWRPQWPECPEVLLTRFRQKQGDTKGTKEFIRVPMLFEEHTATEVISAVETALSANVGSAEAVMHLMANSGDNAGGRIRPLDDWPRFPPADVSIYGRLGGGS